MYDPSTKSTNSRYPSNKGYNPANKPGYRDMSNKRSKTPSMLIPFTHQTAAGSPSFSETGGAYAINSFLKCVSGCSKLICKEDGSPKAPLFIFTPKTFIKNRSTTPTLSKNQNSMIFSPNIGDYVIAESHKLSSPDGPSYLSIYIYKYTSDAKTKSKRFKLVTNRTIKMVYSDIKKGMRDSEEDVAISSTNEYVSTHIKTFLTAEKMIYLEPVVLAAIDKSNMTHTSYSWYRKSVLADKFDKLFNDY